MKASVRRNPHLAVALLLGAAMGLWARPATAQDEPADEPIEDTIEAAPAAEASASVEEEEDAAPAAGERLEAIVRGFYVEGKLGGGFMLVNQPVVPDAFNPNATGDEGYGVGGLVMMTAGYDIIDMVAVQVFGGTLMSDTRRRDVVRDMSMYYAGAGARLAIDITDRLDYTAQVGAMFVSADDAVRPDPEQGFGVLVSTGLEYYVRVRHFSVGLDVTMILPVQPVRMFLAVTPSFKYTF